MAVRIRFADYESKDDVDLRLVDFLREKAETMQRNASSETSRLKEMECLLSAKAYLDAAEFALNFQRTGT